jgi:hypothetical protein
MHGDLISTAVFPPYVYVQKALAVDCVKDSGEFP